MHSIGTTLPHRRTALFAGAVGLVVALVAMSAAPAHAQGQKDTTTTKKDTATTKTDSTAKPKASARLRGSNGGPVNIQMSPAGGGLQLVPGGQDDGANTPKPQDKPKPQLKTDSATAPKDTTAAKKQPKDSAAAKKLPGDSAKKSSTR